MRISSATWMILLLGLALAGCSSGSSSSGGGAGGAGGEGGAGGAGGRVAGPHVHRVFGREDEAVPFRTHEVAKKLLAGSVGIEVGGVDEVPTAARVGVEDDLAGIVVCPPPPVAAKRHRSQADRADTETASSKKPILIETCDGVVVHACFSNVRWSGSGHTRSVVVTFLH